MKCARSWGVGAVRRYHVFLFVYMAAPPPAPTILAFSHSRIPKPQMVKPPSTTRLPGKGPVAVSAPRLPPDLNSLTISTIFLNLHRFDNPAHYLYPPPPPHIPDLRSAPPPCFPRIQIPYTHTSLPSLFDPDFSSAAHRRPSLKGGMARGPPHGTTRVSAVL